MALLEGHDLTKRFGGLDAVDGVSFAVESGEAVGLIGPNGAGKSTLFRLLAGVLRPTEGRVVFDGEDVTGTPSNEMCRRGLVKTHQIVSPFEDLTLLENAAVGAEFGSRDGGDSGARAREALEFVGLADRASAMPDELSVGALKRLEVARVLATDPEVLLFDEVAAGLDAEETEELIDLVDEVRARGTTVFVVDHVMRAIMSVSDRIMVLDNGRLVADGPPDEIRDDERVVEAYLGERAGSGSAPAMGEPSP